MSPPPWGRLPYHSGRWSLQYVDGLLKGDMPGNLVFSEGLGRVGSNEGVVGKTEQDFVLTRDGVPEEVITI